MIKNLTIIVVLIAICSISNAQFFVPKQKDALKLEGRKLIVRLEEPDYKLLRKYKKKPKELERYKNEVALRNDILKKSVEKYWNLQKQIENQVNYDADDKAKADKRKQYAVLYTEFGEETMRTTKTIKKFPCFRVALRLSEDKYPLFSVSLPSSILSELDYKFIFHQFDKYIAAGIKGAKTKSLWDVEKNLNTLSSTKLIMPKSVTELTLDEVKEEYPHDIEMLNNIDDVEAMALSDDHVLYITSVWSEIRTSYMLTVVDSKTMDIVALLGEGRKKFSLYIPLGINLIDVVSYKSDLGLTRKHFKYLASRKAMEKNNKTIH
ncbi:MAG: hypothetical protein N4A74_19060 [Carboxylicivirga sp.]|jgi:hypothetical protein|nr:hypothetical protein [Carboxylicivirga sp.]